MGQGRAEAYECTVGAATRPLRCGYQRREPEKTVLHEMVASYLETFLAELAQLDQTLPRYVEQELRRYLPCGLLSYGFARVSCRECGDEILVAFSCKGRAFCPSCCARRMSDTAAHLVDRVFPVAPYRQWVLAYPIRLRFVLARNAKAASESAAIFLREVFRFLRKKARRLGHDSAKPGAVSFTQRFGGQLNLNVHHHAIVPDGIFVVDGQGKPAFKKLECPRVEELECILTRIVKKTLAMLVRRGLIEDEPSDGLSALQAEAVQTGMGFEQHEPARSVVKLSAFIEGFSLEAGTHVHESDRQGLEHLSRYCLRPPLSLKRMRRLDDGRAQIELKRKLRDGRWTIALTAQQLLRRLASIVPPPRAHLVRYHGVFASRSAIRKAIVPRPQPENKQSDAEPVLELKDGLANLIEPASIELRPRRLPWAELLKRVFANDVLQCSCGGRRKVIAIITNPKQAREILDTLKIDAPELVLAKARAPPIQECFDLPVDDSGVDPPYVEAL